MHGSRVLEHGSRVMGRRSWDMDRGIWVAGDGSWDMSRGSWAGVGRGRRYDRCVSVQHTIAHVSGVSHS